ncbi:uncharacterized protein LOC143043038 [Mytilus galloprovincialis]|uniref:uncharacterized protein LOC143043038 n=1 Tax=Mytilus galloprovincialis TaxID=29158 RepID=UPI003F7C6178
MILRSQSESTERCHGGCKQVESHDKKLAKQFPSIGTSDAAEEEFTSLRYIIASKMKDQTLRQVLEKTAKMTDLYPILSKYCQIDLEVPVSTSDCERTFSTLNRVRTILRNTQPTHSELPDDNLHGGTFYTEL